MVALLLLWLTGRYILLYRNDIVSVNEQISRVLLVFTVCVVQKIDRWSY